MKTYGLVGYPLSHSFSKKYFTEKFSRENISDCEFKNFPLEDIAEFPALIRSTPSLYGLSITIPYKKKIVEMLDKVSKPADEINAVNCIKIDKRNQLLIGYNTDHEGFTESLKPLLQPHHIRALILGTGGAAKAVAYGLDKLKIKFSYVSRLTNSKLKKSTILSYSEINQKIIKEHLLVINTTPLGMFPDISTCPDIPFQYLTDKHLLYDLNYNPEETLFLKKGKEKGAQIKNGLEMLHFQAEKAWEIWNS